MLPPSWALPVTSGGRCSARQAEIDVVGAAGVLLQVPVSKVVCAADAARRACHR